MTDQKILALDIDQVVADLHHAWLQRYNKAYDDTLTCSDITQWDMTKLVKPACGKLIYNFLHDKTLYDDVPVMPGALDFVNDMRAEGFRVVFVTASNVHMAGRKLHWLEEHGFLTLTHGTLSRDFVECQDKSLVRAWALVDDHHENLKNFQCHRVLMNEFHNQNLDVRDGFYRAFGFADAGGYLLNTRDREESRQTSILDLLNGKSLTI